MVAFQVVPYNLPQQRRQQHYRPTILTRLSLDKKRNSNDDDGANKKSNNKPYRFGDLSRSLLKRTTDSINQVTGKSEYTFGDLTKSLGRNITVSINGKNATGAEYRFGDITKAFVQNFTDKDDYQVGDLTKEVVRRIQNGEYSADDAWLALKVLLAVGANVSPVASLMPVKLLLQLVDFSVTQEVGDRLLGILAKALDERFKEAVTGDKDYALGDLSKKAFLRYLEKDEYEFGDLSRKIMNDAAQQQDVTAKSKSTSTSSQDKPSTTGGGGKHTDLSVLLQDSAVLADLERVENRTGLIGSATDKA